MRIIKLVFLLFLSFPVLSQFNMNPYRIFESDVYGPFELQVCDIDLDGDVDVFCGSIDSKEVGWFENDSMGLSYTYHFIDDLNYPKAIFAAYVDADSLQDLIVGAYNHDKLGWYQNLGNGDFSQLNVISTNLDGPSDICASDLDMDGDLDIVACGQANEKVRWYINDGTGGFTDGGYLSGYLSGPTSVYTADINGDTLPDILVASFYDDKFSWYQNLGNNQFGTQNLFPYNQDGAYSIRADDLDNDGDNDVVGAVMHNDEVIWFENLGNGVFSLKNVITDQVNQPSVVEIIDLNEDGYKDIVSQYGSATNGNTMTAVFFNDGLASFGTQPWTTIYHGSSSTFTFADFNNDTITDIVAATRSSNRVRLYFGDTLPAWGNPINLGYVYPEHGITDTCDWNSDGFTDIITLVGSSVFYYQNKGNLEFELPIKIHSNLDYPQFLVVGDINADGNPDVIINEYLDSTILCLLGGSTGTIDSVVVAASGVYRPKKLMLAGADLDQDLDIFCTSVSGSELLWVENLGNLQFAAPVSLSSALDGIIDLVAADLNNDGLPEILTVCTSSDKLSLFRNNGNGVFQSEEIVSTACNGPHDLTAGDIDGDGDFDIAVCSWYDDEVSWFENTNDTLSIQHVLSNDFDQAFTIGLCDLDIDGDLEIIAGGYSAENLVIYENLGNGSFDDRELLLTGYTYNYNMYFCDFDRDLDPDILTRTYNPHQSVMIENNGLLFTDSIVVCSNDLLVFAGDTISSAGHYFDTLLTTNGLDSIRELVVEVNSSYYVYDSVSICAGDFYYFHNYGFISQTGIYVDTLYTMQNCDSVVELHLSVQDTFMTFVYDTICEGDVYDFQGQLLFQGGYYTDTLFSQSGCDSLIGLYLHEKDAYNFIYYSEKCEGDTSYFGNHIITESGIYVDSNLTHLGCDSLHTLTIEFFPAYEFFDTLFICSNDSVLFGNSYLYESGDYAFNDQTLSGCDSVMNINLNVWEVFSDTSVYSVCEGDSIYWRGNFYNETGFFVDSFHTVFACDSLYCLDMQVHTDVFEYIEALLCEGDSFILGNQVLYTSGAFIDTLTTTYGCDSVVLLDLTVNPVFLDTIQEQICEFDSLWFGYQYLTSTGFYFHSYQSQYGCDSLVYLDLLVNPLPLVHLDDFNEDTVCFEDQLIPLPMGIPFGGVFDGPGISNTDFNPIDAGIGSHFITYSVQNDTSFCWNSDSAGITVVDCSAMDEHLTEEFRIFPNPGSELINISTSVPLQEVSVFNSIGQKMFFITFEEPDKQLYTIDFKSLKKGIYLLQLKSSKSSATKRLILVE